MDYSKWDQIKDPDEKSDDEPLDYAIDSDGEPPKDEPGDLKVIVKKTVYKEIVQVGDGLDKPGRPYIVEVKAKGWVSDNEQVFVEHEKPVFITLGDAWLPKGLWKSIEHMKKGEQSKIKIMPGEFSFEEKQTQLEYNTNDEDLKQEM